MEPVLGTKSSTFDCPICLEELLLKDVYALLDSCKHSLCKPCFHRLVNYSHNCPLCCLSFSGCTFMNEKDIVDHYSIEETELANVKKNKNSTGIINNLYKFPFI